MIRTESKVEKARLRAMQIATESNRIEGITRSATAAEIHATADFLDLKSPGVGDLVTFVAVCQPDARLRDKPGLNVRVGNYIAPTGGPEIKLALATLLDRARAGESPWQIHVDYEMLHPFTDCNGRSGRVLWWWQTHHYNQLPFLHRFYYQTLESV